MSKQTHGEGANLTRITELRRRRRARKLRSALLLAAAVLAAAVLAVAAYFTGVYSEALAAAGEAFDSVRIALAPAAGWPVKTGVPEVVQLEGLAGGFVELGKQDLVVYSGGGNRLRSIQHGYARPALSAGNSRFCIYSRAGYELRVESRSRTLSTQTFDRPILLAEMSPNGSLAVVTDSSRYMAELTIYDPAFRFRYAWNPTEKEGLPSRIAFAADNKRFAVACLTAENGSLTSNIFLLDTRSDQVTARITASGGQVLQMHWLTADKLLVIYDHMAAVYDPATGEQKAVFSYGGEQLVSASVCGQNAALLFGPELADSPARLAVLDPQMQLLADARVPAPARGVVCTRTAAYILRESSVAAYTLAGEADWEAALDAPPLAVLDAKQLLVFAGGEARALTGPETGGAQE